MLAAAVSLLAATSPSVFGDVQLNPTRPVVDRSVTASVLVDRNLKRGLAWASETDDKVDKKLEAIATEVRRTQPKLKGFQLVKMCCKSLEVGKADDFGSYCAVLVTKWKAVF